MSAMVWPRLRLMSGFRAAYVGGTTAAEGEGGIR